MRGSVCSQVEVPADLLGGDPFRSSAWIVLRMSADHHMSCLRRTCFCVCVCHDWDVGAVLTGRVKWGALEED